MTSRSVWSRALSGIAALTVVGVAGTACTEFKETLEEANRSLSTTLSEDGTPADGAEGDEQEALSSTAVASALYDQGLQLKVEGRDAEAFERFREAAERGHGPAAYELGEAYNAGRGVDRDLSAGAKWINAAAGRGEPRAQYALGETYYNGAGVERDYARAVRYLGNAADQGHASAQYLLGECYANGRGVPKNLLWAARWYGKAAMQGHAEGAFSYGVVHAAGLGVPEDLASGYAWLDIASTLGHTKAAEVRGAVANKMTPDQIEASKRRARAFSQQSEAAFADRPTVMYVQHSLNQLGFNAGPVDGLMGPRTRSAISGYLSSIGNQGAPAEISPALVQQLFEGQQNAA